MIEFEEELNRALSGYIGDPPTEEDLEKMKQSIMDVYKSLFKMKVEILDEKCTKDRFECKVKMSIEDRKIS